jgi:uracil-DNA glycosylase family 4
MTATSAPARALAGPGRDCVLCPRLADYLAKHRDLYPDWHNAPVPAFGGADAWLLIVGLAPGLRGANRTGRPFTGDGAGDLLYPTLVEVGLARGTYDLRADDGLELIGVRITNAVRCVPPENKPTALEARTCRPFLVAEIDALSDLKVIMALGKIAHDAVLATLKLPKKDYKFGHNARHDLPGGLTLVDSYHCSRYNVNTRRLTPQMFTKVFRQVLALN